ncbi:WecB/TagA/CpsF family glycosyltransferase [filamentous cyanobacterium LEGE 11480]|uniref:WecB/TagA/CpsF family glycosyltransferase n=1 Tax=Romeriopsis navalis LEGE 11480 TaxID=2777977 RepID=A0A928VJD1_9CYAN|nr:WecB/TagA/CpsF family glycosyltransferase [Romeriopsis navalis]MBE9028808.1 WecB/TagA/CpsF family glycosyltransferase [Romeriopsis navalis LEGE 11480]
MLESSVNPPLSTGELPQFKEVVLMDTRFHQLTVQQLIDYVTRAAKLPQKTVVGHVNIRGMNFAAGIPWYRQFLNRADLVFCDGFGVLLGAKLKGYKLCNCHRMTCPDYIEDLALACEQQQVSLFLLAGQPGITDQAIAKLTTIAPNLQVAGHHGHFAKTGAENAAVVEQINQFNPDVLYIGFGMPLQERWIKENYDQVNTRVFLPLGACLDFYTGSVARGPQWMTNFGLEWLSRLVVEPKRLWRRYLIGNPLFYSRVLVDVVRHRLGRSRR